MKLSPCLATYLCIAATAANGSEPQLEHIIVTATQRDASNLDLPMSASVVTARDLEIVHQVHLSDAFQRVAGGWISRGNGQESLTALRSPVLTGPGSCGSFFMASDGISLRAPGFCNVNQMFDANTEQAQRIEVLKGPATALYGSGALHGVINVISREPAEALQHHIAVEGGPHDYRRGRYHYSNTYGDHGIMLAANASSDGGYKRSSGYDQQKATLRHRYNGSTFSTDTIVVATNLDQDTAGFITGYKAYKNSHEKKDNPNPDAYRDAESTHFQSTLSFSTGEFSELTITPYWRDNDMEFLQHFFPWLPTEKNGHESFGLKTRYYNTGTWLETVTGVDVETTDGWLKETQPDPFSPAQPQGTHYDYRVDAQVAAAWSQLTLDVARNLDISAGARFEYTEYDYHNQTGDGPACRPEVTNCRFYRPADSKDEFNNWSLNLAALYDIVPGQTAFLRLVRGFRAPETAELYRLQGSQAQADLDSEELKGVEIGSRGILGDLQYELGLYYSEKDNVIFQDSDRRNISGAKTRHYGLEMTVRWQLSPTVDLAVDATLARHEYDSNLELIGTSGNIKGNQMDTAPEYFGSARAGWEFLPGYRTELEWVHMSDYFLDPDNLHKYDGHDVVNLRIIGQVSERVNVGLRATNLTDTDFAERADYGFGSYRYFVGEPRSVYFEIGYSLAP